MLRDWTQEVYFTWYQLQFPFVFWEGFFCLFVFLDYKLESKAILFLQGGHWSQE